MKSATILNAGRLALIALGPEMMSFTRIDKLSIDANRIASASHAALEDILDPEILSDFLHLGRLVLIGKGRVARDHEQTINFRKVGDQIFGDAVGEMLLLGIVAQIGEW